MHPRALCLVHAANLHRKLPFDPASDVCGNGLCALAADQRSQSRLALLLRVDEAYDQDAAHHGSAYLLLNLCLNLRVVLHIHWGSLARQAHDLYRHHPMHAYIVPVPYLP